MYSNFGMGYGTKEKKAKSYFEEYCKQISELEQAILLERILPPSRQN
jgi:hypothetical protein